MQEQPSNVANNSGYELFITTGVLLFVLINLCLYW